MHLSIGSKGLDTKLLTFFQNSWPRQSFYMVCKKNDMLAFCFAHNHEKGCESGRKMHKANENCLSLQVFSMRRWLGKQFGPCFGVSSAKLRFFIHMLLLRMPLFFLYNFCLSRNPLKLMERNCPKSSCGALWMLSKHAVPSSSKLFYL